MNHVQKTICQSNHLHQSRKTWRVELCYSEGKHDQEVLKPAALFTITRIITETQMNTQMKKKKTERKKPTFPTKFRKASEVSFSSLFVRQ